MPGKIMIIGVGDLGFHILQFLARTPGISSVVAADVDETRGEAMAYDAVFGSSFLGYYPEIEFRRVDLYDVKGTAEVLRQVKPDVICNATTLQSWWVLHTLPEKMYQRISQAGLGLWVPMHLTLTHKLMQAIKRAGIGASVVNCSFPDVVNPMLHRRGLSPTIGGGNFALRVPWVREVVADELGIPIRSVQVFMVAFHSLTTHLDKAPFWVKICVDGSDVTDRFPQKMLRERMMKFQRARTGAGWRGPPPQQQTASCFLKNVLAIYFDTGELVHATGPKGLWGGYPVRLSAEGAEVVIPKGLTLDEALEVNRQGAKLDGIEEMRDDGSIVFTEQAVKVMRETLGYECERLTVEESDERARELDRLYRRYSEKK